MLNLFTSICLLLSVFSRAGKSSPTLSDHRIRLQCLNDFILLELDLQDIPKVKPTSLHLRHFSCGPHEVLNATAIFRVPFQGCGTTRGIDSNHIVYQNVVVNSQKFNRSRVVVRHVPELRYPFTCRYRLKYTLTLKQGQTREHKKEEGPRKENSTREDFPDDADGPLSGAPCLHLPILWFLLLGFRLWL